MVGVSSEKVGAATAILKGIGAPINQRTVGAMVGWFNAEGGQWGNNAHFNPLNTTQGAPGAGSINSVGVKSYANWNQGVQATVQTLRNGHYGDIINAFKQSDPSGVARAIGSSPWGTNGSLVARTISSATGQPYQLGHASVSNAGFSQSPTTASTTFSGGGTDVNSAGVAALLKGASKPINPSGAFKADNLLSDFASNIESGNYKLPSIANTHLSSTPAAVSASGKPLPGNTSHGGGFLPSNAPYTPGRHDQGRDGTTTPGGAILANGDGVVVRVGFDPNGFGPRYPIVRFTSGPDAGKEVYFGHTLAVVRPGDHVHNGQTISHTGTHGVGNATVPGWFEIGFAPGGVPGPFGQPTPF